MLTSMIPTVLFCLIILIGLFLLCREVMCWYWKINKLVALLESIDRKLGKTSIRKESLPCPSQYGPL